MCLDEACLGSARCPSERSSYGYSAWFSLASARSSSRWRQQRFHKDFLTFKRSRLWLFVLSSGWKGNHCSRSAWYQGARAKAYCCPLLSAVAALLKASVHTPMYHSWPTPAALTTKMHPYSQRAWSSDVRARAALSCSTYLQCFNERLFMLASSLLGLSALSSVRRGYVYRWRYIFTLCLSEDAATREGS